MSASNLESLLGMVDAIVSQARQKHAAQLQARRRENREQARAAFEDEFATLDSAVEALEKDHLDALRKLAANAMQRLAAVRSDVPEIVDVADDDGVQSKLTRLDQELDAAGRLNFLPTDSAGASGRGGVSRHHSAASAGSAGGNSMAVDDKDDEEEGADEERDGSKHGVDGEEDDEAGSRNGRSRHSSGNSSGSRRKGGTSSDFPADASSGGSSDADVSAALAAASAALLARAGAVLESKVAETAKAVTLLRPSVGQMLGLLEG